MAVIHGPALDLRHPKAGLQGKGHLPACYAGLHPHLLLVSTLCGFSSGCWAKQPMLWSWNKTGIVSRLFWDSEISISSTLVFMQNFSQLPSAVTIDSSCGSHLHAPPLQSLKWFLKAEIWGSPLIAPFFHFVIPSPSL